MNRIEITGNSVALDADGLGNNVTGATFTLTANDAGDSLAHKVTVLNNTANDHSAKTLALVGTGSNGEAQTETLTAPAGSVSVTSAKYYKTLTSITPSATIGADTFDIGWAAVSVSAWVPVEKRVGAFNIGFGCTVVSGTPTYTVQHTYDKGVATFNHATVASETTSQDGTYTSPVEAIRLSWAAAGEVTLTGYQASDRY